MKRLGWVLASLVAAIIIGMILALAKRHILDPNLPRMKKSAGDVLYVEVPEEADDDD